MRRKLRLRSNSGYAQIGKELLAIVLACEKFNKFAYGKNVEVETDHKPLVSIFKKSLKLLSYEITTMRLLRLQQYDLQVTYKKGTEFWFLLISTRVGSKSIV